MEPAPNTTIRRVATLTFFIESGLEKHALIFPGPLEKRQPFVKEFEAACERYAYVMITLVCSLIVVSVA